MEKIPIMGILSNVDYSILDLKLKDNFEIKSISKDKVIDQIHENLYIPKFIIDHDLSMLSCYHNNKVFYITKTDFNPSGSQESMNKQFDYLLNTIDLIRLFKEGNIRISYLYQKRENPINIVVSKSDKFVYPELFHVDNEELQDLQIFIDNTKIPFTEEILELALENFNLSYSVENLNLQFLCLMNGIEVLFNPNQGELTYRISRNLAVLLGENEKEGEEIQKKIKKLYIKRSKIVHSGKTNIDNDDLIQLRYYTRESIKRFYKINKSKDKILKKLNSSGFDTKINF